MKKILIFERAGLLFLYNLHPLQSYPDLEFEVPPGRYRLVLDSDAPEFSGHGRVAPAPRALFFTFWPQSPVDIIRADGIIGLRFLPASRVLLDSLPHS